MDKGLHERCYGVALSVKTTPVLAEAIDSLFQLLKSQGASPQRFLATTSAGAWLTEARDVGQLLAQGRLDRAVIDRALAEIAAPGLAPAAIVDGFLTPHILLAAARPHWTGSPPDWLVDALAALVAVDALDALLDPVAAEELLDGAPGCLTLPWLARQTLVGRWLSRVLTPAGLWRVLAGKDDWSVALSPDLLAACEAIRAGRAAPLHAQTHEEDDVFALMDALHGLMTARVRRKGLPVAELWRPAGGGLVWHLASGELRAVGDPTSLTQVAAQGLLEPPVHSLPVPLPLGAGLRAEGWQGLRLELDDAEAADELIDALLDLTLDPLPPQTLDGPGFRIVPVFASSGG